MPLRDDGKPKGFAFVAFSTGKEAQKASVASLELDGRELRVNIGKGGQDNARQGGR
jgi:RNA recognition motif-containing protein